MTVFQQWVKILIDEIEGGYSNDPNDPGGRTIYGISERAHPEMWKNGPPSREACELAYKPDYWNPCRCDELKSAKLACRVADAAVNCGIGRAGRWLQESINWLRNPAAQLVVDGNIGVKTLAAENALVARGQNYELALVSTFTHKQADHYEALLTARPQQFGAYKVSWMSRLEKYDGIA